ncbi:unnamed protein product [Prorocentrum cordatum]|uniref:Uncharacterized protein n=1 Tax=Prorocentrum cordatum TaxID=2364126 RepID=A0ABN9T3P5_9DINO|nr:unnamed protein product [Polarella glacialis]
MVLRTFVRHRYIIAPVRAAFAATNLLIQSRIVLISGAFPGRRPHFEGGTSHTPPFLILLSLVLFLLLPFIILLLVLLALSSFSRFLPQCRRSEALLTVQSLFSGEQEEDEQQLLSSV